MIKNKSPVIRTYEFKLKPRKSYRKKYDKWIGCCRFIYNLGKEAKDIAYQNFNKTLTAYDLCNQLKYLKEEYSFLKEVYSQTLQLVIKRLDKSYQRFLKNPKEVGFPKFAKKGVYKSFEFANVCNALRFTEKGFRLPSFGEIKIFNHNIVLGKVKLARIIDKAGDLYLQIVMEVEKEPLYTKNENQVIGIDMGVKYFYTDSNGLHINNPKHLFKYLKRLRLLQRSLSRKIKGSNNCKKSIRKIQKLHLKVRNVRRDFHHKISTNLARNNSHIVVEDLDIKNMCDKLFAKHIMDCGWNEFFTILEYKCNLIRVNPKYTSQKCCVCGYTSRDNRKTQSHFSCESCGHMGNADVNAAINIKDSGLAEICTIT